MLQPTPAHRLAGARLPAQPPRPGHRAAVPQSTDTSHLGPFAPAGAAPVSPTATTECQGNFWGGNTRARAPGRWLRWDAVVIATAGSSWVPAPLPLPATESGSLQELGGDGSSGWPLRDAARPLGVTHPILPRRVCPEAAIGLSLVRRGHRCHLQQRGRTQALSASSAWQSGRWEGIQGGCGSRRYRHRRVLDPCEARSDTGSSRGPGGLAAAPAGAVGGSAVPAGAAPGNNPPAPPEAPAHLRQPPRRHGTARRALPGDGKSRRD